MAVDIRFFQRLGIPPAAAVTASAIDSFTGNVIQVVLLVLLLLFSQTASLDLNANVRTSGPDARLLVALVVVLALTIIVLVAIGRVRQAIGERLRTWWPQVRDCGIGLRAARKLAYLLGGCLVTE